MVEIKQCNFFLFFLIDNKSIFFFFTNSLTVEIISNLESADLFVCVHFILIHKKRKIVKFIIKSKIINLQVISDRF